MMRVGAELLAPRTTRASSQSTPHYNSDSSRKRRKYNPARGASLGGRWTDLDQSDLLQSTSQTAPASTPQSHTVDPEMTTAPSRFSSAADAAAAAVQTDGYKPREERSWDTFHPDLDLDATLMVFSADEVDGISADHMKDFQQSPGEAAEGETLTLSPVQNANITSPQKRRPGRPPRRPESMLSGLGSPPAQKPMPLPAQNPRERLTLPKPSFRKVDTFGEYEMDNQQKNYVDKALALAGYQEGDLFLREDRLIRLNQKSSEDEGRDAVNITQDGDKQSSAGGAVTIRPVTQVEYDMDEQDEEWLEAFNAYRKEVDGHEPIRPAVFEITMTQIEKEWHALEKRIPKPNPKPPQTHRPRSSSAAAVNGEAGAGEEQDSKCAVCDDGDCENTNAIVFCDGCDLAVHQECYGVPFIPEGQWLCRKCQQIGRATPTCIFCPNTEGAFKLTTESRWAHLICAIWIPEVNLGNTTFMEPVMEVAKVPKSRWKLNCYICNQKMGACIQCGNKNCYQAFHVTCGRRAKLYLKMKSSHFGPASADASVLKAYCDKHVPSEWRREHDVDRATREAKSYYRREMKGTRWADSQQAALALVPSQHFQAAEPIEPMYAPDDTQNNSAAAIQKRKKMQELQKKMWRLPSGAPIVPNVVYNAVSNSIQQKFKITNRKEFIAEVCKYWTLKREARRGAALLKRLQVQLETFSTSEIARRNFAGMGVAGGPRLQRRIDFAEQLLQEMSYLRLLCQQLKDRESAKLEDARLLKHAVDTIYFPITALLWPILEKMHDTDKDDYFTESFKDLETKLEHRQYTSVCQFSADISAIFQSVTGIDSVSDATEVHNRMAATSGRNMTLNSDQKEVLKVAKRIIKAAQQPLREAMRKEAELRGRPYEKELRDLETLLNNSVGQELGDAQDLDASQIGTGTNNNGETALLVNGVHDPHLELNETTLADGEEPDANMEENPEMAVDEEADNATDIGNDVEMTEADDEHSTITNGRANGGNQLTTNGRAASMSDSPNADGTANTKGSGKRPQPDPLTPPSSEKDLLAPLIYGGVPWYLETFDPIGTTVHDERWTGREVLRGMTEELSEIDEDELKGLGENVDEAMADIEDLEEYNKSTTLKRKAAGKKRKRRGVFS